MSVYLDNNATTPPAPEVVEAMRACLEETWGNPSSSHRAGMAARRRLDLARDSVAALLGCAPREVVFTSGGTESANLAIVGAFRRIHAAHPRRRLLACPPTEHPAVSDALRGVGVLGGSPVSMEVDDQGLVDMESFEQLLARRGDEIAICSVMWANNETGVIQPVEEIARRCREHDVVFHTDAVQWVGREPTCISESSIDLLSCSAHKFHGPKGAGALVVRSGLGIESSQLGGPQERQRRGGTENVPAIAGFGIACDIAREWLAGDARPGRIALRDRFESRLLGLHEGACINSGRAPRLWNTTNISFPGLRAQLLLVILSEHGVSASGGAACASGSIEVSGVLGAMGLDEDRAAGSLRFSFARDTTEAELDRAVGIIDDVLRSSRRQAGGDR